MDKWVERWAFTVLRGFSAKAPHIKIPFNIVKLNSESWLGKCKTVELSNPGYKIWSIDVYLIFSFFSLNLTMKKLLGSEFGDFYFNCNLQEPRDFGLFILYLPLHRTFYIIGLEMWHILPELDGNKSWN